MTKKPYRKPATVTVASAPSVCAATSSDPRIVVVDSKEDEADPDEEML